MIRQLQAHPKFLVGRHQIADYCGISASTISRWIKTFDFPAARFPNGPYLSSSGLIDCWLAAMWETQRKEREKQIDDLSDSALQARVQTLERQESATG